MKKQPTDEIYILIQIILELQKYVWSKIRLKQFPQRETSKHDSVFSNLKLTSSLFRKPIQAENLN